MALDKALRNTLRHAVTRCRKLLEEAVGDVLEGKFGVRRDGKVESAENMGHLSAMDTEYREQVLHHLRHLQASGFTPAEATARLIREVAYTHLNRLCAYKMAERRKLILETVGRGMKSKGFLFYLAEHPEDERLWSTGRQDEAYRHFLDWRGSELSEEMEALFSPADPADRLSPTQRVLEAVLDLINSDELEEVWDQDETIGWVYQYYTPKELRDQARKESSAPRNSYELSFRNQFYTPRYVVEFLVDNTLGRTWYEMRGGRTRLVDKCAYLVRRPDEVFLAPASEDQPHGIADAQRWLQGESVAEPDAVHLGHTVNGYARVPGFGEGGNRWVEERLSRLPASTEEFGTQELLDLLFLLCRKDRFVEGTLEHLAVEVEAIVEALRDRAALGAREDLSQEERLCAPVFIPHRHLKDPRELKVLDPACGSGHFLLYCFDLLEIIYEEAYDDERIGGALREEYPDWEEFRHAVPCLILRHNLYGVDIDLRATQIAALALWLRAQRSYEEMKLSKDKRPKIARSNIVCAGPMPGERPMLEEFLVGVDPRLQALVVAVWDSLELASEAGSLLKIEEKIDVTFKKARRESLLIPPPTPNGSSVPQPTLEYGTPEDRAFWEEARRHLFDTLEAYVEEVSNGRAYGRRLFAEDAEQGLALVTLLCDRYDVVLMNPPFGEASIGSKRYVRENYPRTKNDVFATFVERGLHWLVDGGFLGVITSRTGFFLTSFQKWREEIVLGAARPTVVADLGQGVLDTAMVETAAYALEKVP